MVTSVIFKFIQTTKRANHEASQITCEGTKCDHLCLDIKWYTKLKSLKNWIMISELLELRLIFKFITAIFLFFFFVV